MAPWNSYLFAVRSYENGGPGVRLLLVQADNEQHAAEKVIMMESGESTTWNIPLGHEYHRNYTVERDTTGWVKESDTDETV